MRLRSYFLAMMMCFATSPPTLAQSVNPGAVDAPPPSGFTMDMSRDDAQSKLGVLTFSDATPGQAHKLDLWSMCRHDGRIWIRGDVQISEVDTHYLTWFSATRTADGFDIAIEENHRGELDMASAEKILLTRDCSQAARTLGVDLAALELQPVLTVLGTKSASGLFSLLRDGASAPEAAVQSDWEITEETDDITDQANVYAFLKSSKGVADDYGNLSHPTLVLRCQRDTTSVYFVFSHFEVNDTMQLSFRLDQAKHQVRTLSTSSNHKAAGLWRGNAAIPFVKQLRGASVLHARLQGRSETLTLEYDLSGIETVLEKVSDACNWAH